ncbi:S9 family peptidase [Mycobacterium sp. WMMD1722]|uniref:S9 family peptidase n=1 Tax=Mycobacterium sp. WMMD1722 TaxID=3404117 RepID=UPI003BF58F3F
MTPRSESTPFADLDDYLTLPRVSGLTVSPDGTRVVTTISEIDDAGVEFVTAVWELDTRGAAPARRLTRGAKGERNPAFTDTGDLLFLASRPTKDDAAPPAALWRLPADGGEAVEEFTSPGGVNGVLTARAAARTAVHVPVLASATDLDEDKRLRALRKDNKVSAVLHRGYPVRHWDHDLGPDQPHLFDSADGRDLAPHPGGGLRDARMSLSDDGRFIVTSWYDPSPGAALRGRLVRIDLDSGQRATLADDQDADLDNPAISPDGTAVAFTRETVSTPLVAPRITLCHLTFGGQVRELTAGWDRWPTSVTWTRDGTALLVTADENGRGPVFSVDPASGRVRRLTDDDYTYTDVSAAPGGVIYALRSSYAAPPHPVRIDPDGSLTELACVAAPPLPGALSELSTVTEDGVAVRSWLAVPAGADAEHPAPLLLWVHGGPLASWNAWHWRWNPWLMVAQGYAVLLPDPALSTGYGQDFVQRGWGAWGAAPFTDLMAATDAAAAVPGVDDGRTAVMGGSFGGYMANWIAGHTDRFDAIVTHAGLWALDQFGATTDGAYWWAREMTPDMAERNSPHLFVEHIATPMLVIHGDKDYRVPMGEALRLWYELLTRSRLPADESGSGPHRFLNFPSENHWVLAPQHAKIWYQVVFAFLAEHVLGRDADLPELLG